MRRSILLIFAVLGIACPLAQASTARLLSSQGDVEVRRGEKLGVARGRVELQPGDELTTEPGGAANVLFGESMFYLGSHAQLSIHDTAQGPLAKLAQGRARIVVVRQAKLRLVTPKLNAELAEGIYQVTVEPRQTRLHNVTGKAIVSSTDRAQRSIIQTAFQQVVQPKASAQQIVPPGESIAVPPTVEKGPTDADELADESVEEQRRRRSLQDEAADEAEEQDLAQQDQSQQDDQLPDQDEPASSRGTGAPTSVPGPGSQNYIASGGISSSFGGLAASFSPGSGGFNGDAAQSTNQGQIVANPPQGSSIGDPFPGNIHLLTSESRYAIGGVELLPSEVDAIFPSVDNDPVYFSIGTGAIPNTQVFTDFLTATDLEPTIFSIPGFDAYVVKFTQFGTVDAGLFPVEAEQNTAIGITGLVGANPPAPSVIGATPTADERAVFNDLATFALGEFRLRTDGGDDQDSFELAVRRSDQDRLIVKDPGGNDALDQVTPLPGVVYNDVPDPRFQPAAPTVKIADPSTRNPDPQTYFSQVNNLRRAAATTILANQLHDFAQRTGQTRFVVDGKIVDISGYKK